MGDGRWKPTVGEEGKMVDKSRDGEEKEGEKLEDGK